MKAKKLNLVFLGPPGAGKGTQAQLISQKYKIPHISTGDIFRNEISAKTPLSNKIKNYIEKGLLIPDDITNKVIKKRLNNDDCKKGFLLDGYPRNINQARLLDKFLNKNKITACVYFNIDKDECIRRLSARRTCPNCKTQFNLITNPPKQDNLCDNCKTTLIQRDDDNPKTIKKRIEVYFAETYKLIKYYKERNIFFSVNAKGSIKEIYDKIVSLFSVHPICARLENFNF